MPFPSYASDPPPGQYERGTVLPYARAGSQDKSRAHAEERDLIEAVAFGAQPEIWPRPRRIIMGPLIWIDFVVVLCWTAVLWYGFAGKLMAENPEHFGHFLTNWSWMTQLVYFTLKLLSIIFRSGRLLWFTNYVVFWPTWINCWAVAWLVMLVLEDSPGLVTDMFKDVSPGLVLLGDRIYHVVTVLIIVVDFFLTLKAHFGMWFLRTKSIWLLILLEIVVAHMIVLTYLALNDIRSVYDLHDVYWWTMFLCYEAVVIVNGILFMYGVSQFKKLDGLDFST